MHKFAEIVGSCYRTLDTPFSIALSLQLRVGDYEGLVSNKVDPLHYLDSERYGRDVAAVSLLRKCAGLPTGINTRLDTVKQWVEDERGCAKANLRILRALASCEATSLALLEDIRYRMSYLLGSKVPELRYGYSSGSTVSIPYAQRFFINKVCAQKVCMTSTAWVFLRDVASQGLIPPDATLEVVPGNTYGTVPKTSRVDRSICKEPDLNIWVQMALGKAMRRRLNRFGLLLPEGASEQLHRRWAQQGSIDGELATVDLSSASDTICHELVRAVVPQEWLEALSAVRSPMAVFPGTPSREVRLEKFSSMGNGYTFELETALFCAIAMVAMHRCGITPLIGENLSVYGDDILLPASAYAELCEILTWLGFRVNSAKSYATGPFRESCGGDYFGGVDVRPVFQDVIPSTPQEWFSFHNRIYALSRRFPSRGWGAVLRKIREQLPTKLRNIGGPESLGDVVLHGVAPAYRVKNWIRQIKTLQPSHQPFTLDRWDVASALQGLLYHLSLNPDVPQKGIAGLEYDRISYSGSHVSSCSTREPPVIRVPSEGYMIKHIPA